MVDFSALATTKEDFGVIMSIVERAAKLSQDAGYPFDRMSAAMDLEVVHGTLGLRLKDLLEAEQGDFDNRYAGAEPGHNQKPGLQAARVVPTKLEYGARRPVWHSTGEGINQFFKEAE